MGNSLGRLARFLKKQRNVDLAIVGLDSSGKTTLLNRLQRSLDGTPYDFKTTPTVGFSVEEVIVNGARCVVWDLGGQQRLRKLWQHYYSNKDGVVFVIDSADVERIDDTHRGFDTFDNATDELHALLDDPALPKHAPILVLANKQDMEGAIAPEEITRRLQFERTTTRSVRVSPSNHHAACGQPGHFQEWRWCHPS